MTQFPHLNSGNVGPVKAHHMNAVFDAASRVLGESSRVPGSRVIPPKGLWVQLLAESTFGGVSAWSWRAVAKGASAIENDNADLLRSEMWPDGDGLAVELGTSGAVPNGYALIYPLAAFDGKSWFGFASGGGTVQRRLAITSATGTSPPFEYTVSLDGDDVEAINQYEQEPYGYGQGLSFTQGDLVPAACDGTVLCSYVDGAWYFSEPNPMTPSCAA